jgi:hypothetical protein
VKLLHPLLADIWEEEEEIPDEWNEGLTVKLPLKVIPQNVINGEG